MNPAYANRLVRGSCPDCGSLKAEGRSRCEEHLKVHAQRARAYREKRRSASEKKSDGA